ncbi:GDP-L-fucose synthase family protein [Rhizobium sp. P28RR-XV]|uniref:GDP-L-fucose synthase family protein n=1 Tax=Rhizobium sp. P28RR-XV TaxID=2726737 RepID=UPI001457587F|nr:GDP-L-fucose synthase [Rhizobium sp. P28RR-XV]NLR89235.1 GDP-L-fucose synthase [Rhizobium sp. P28RR-XV]
MTDNRKVYSVEGKKIWVAGSTGMVGSAVVDTLKQRDCEIITSTSKDLNLINQHDVQDFLGDRKPDCIILAAAKVGGILANDSYPAEFLYENLMIESNIIGAANGLGVEKLLFLGSSCIYPKHAPQPITEDSLLTGPLEPTNQWYAIAKIAGLMMCDAFRRQYGRSYISAMPTNLYGPRDNFHLQNSHVIPGMMHRFHNAKASGQRSLEIWGSGKPLREFMHVHDLAQAAIFLLEHYDDEGPVNIGTGREVSISELALMVKEVVGFDGEIIYNTNRPDGTPRKLLSNEKLMKLGYEPKIKLEDGLRSTYQWFLDNINTLRIG